MSKVAVIGGGAAGMYAAYTAASYGHEVDLYEKNEKTGKKLYITGKGRCNLTNAADLETIFSNIVSNPKFMYSSLYGHTNRDFLDVMETNGLKVKVERGDRVFPESDKASDVIRTLNRMMEQAGVRVHLNSEVKQVLVSENGERCTGIVTSKEGNINADAVIVATGGLSYASTGSTGDGYSFARKNNMEVTKLCPALVPIVIRENDICRDLMGLSLKNVKLTVLEEEKVLHEGFGEMLFTHFGISGPLCLSASGYLPKEPGNKKYLVKIDLKPALSEEQLDIRIRREFEQAINKSLKNIFPTLFPAKMVPVMLKRCGLDPEKKANSVTREERMRIIENTKSFALTIQGLRGFDEAIITRGGVSVKEINPQTMESKKVKGLYFVGEVLDVDALTGGFNLQIAWSTAYAAGANIEWC